MSPTTGTSPLLLNIVDLPRFASDPTRRTAVDHSLKGRFPEGFALGITVECYGALASGEVNIRQVPGGGRFLHHTTCYYSMRILNGKPSSGHS
jgi:hypothetical protein